MGKKVLGADCLSSDTVIALNLDKFSLEVSPEGRGLFFNQLTGEILSLNKTGAFIVSQLANPITLGELTNNFSIKFELSSEVAATDLHEFLEILDDMTLVQVL